MSYWNYRLFYDGYEWSIAEVHYDVDGRLDMYRDKIELWGETPEELKKDLELMTLAFDKSALTPKDFE